MKDNKINETLLLKNIELLKTYSVEEREKLNAIFDRFASCQNCYKSTNTSKLASKANSLKTNLTTIHSNRNEYTTVLNDVIRRYKETAQSVVQSAKKRAGGDI